MGILLALSVSAGAAYPASAASISASFSGTITEVNDSEGQLDPVIRTGAGFTISYVIVPETAIPPGPCPLWLGAVCPHTVPAGLFLAALTIESSTYDAASDLRVYVGDFPSHVGDYTDRWWLSFTSGDLFIRLEFLDETATRLSDRSFFVNTSLEGWDGGILSIELADGTSGPLARGTVIPEPGVLTLLLPVIVVLIARARLGSHRGRGDSGVEAASD
jgi:hypothetical protein